MRVAVMLAVLTPGLLAQSDPVDKDPLRQRIQDEHVLGTDYWIYNDISRARAVARKENKPLFITFRCVPCEACSSFDADVAKGSEIVKKLAKESFISVRQVEMKGVDLSQFQFDYDLSWAAMFINADGTVYARYGTQSAQGADAFNSVAGLEKTMQRVLRLHTAYPRNKRELAGKRGAPKPFKTAMEMPGLPGTAKKFAQTTTRRNCIHCHMIHDAEHEHAFKTKTLHHDMLWRYPFPENMGVRIDGDDGARITGLTGPAKECGLVVGEDLTHVNGQAISSIADVQWVLHGLKHEPQTLTVCGSRSGEHKITVGDQWKRSDISWRSLWSVAPRLNVWMPPLPQAKRQQLKLDSEIGALEVRWINGGKPGGRAARDAGLRTGDVVIEVGGKPVATTPGQFQMHLKLNYKVGDQLPLTVLRRGKRTQVNVPLVY